MKAAPAALKTPAAAADAWSLLPDAAGGRDTLVHSSGARLEATCASVLLLHNSSRDVGSRHSACDVSYAHSVSAPINGTDVHGAYTLVTTTHTPRGGGGDPVAGAPTLSVHYYMYAVGGGSVGGAVHLELSVTRGSGGVLRSNWISPLGHARLVLPRVVPADATAATASDDVLHALVMP